MRIYWYWPFPHDQELRLARAVPRPGDDLVVHSLAATGPPRRDVTGPYELRRGLPVVPPHDERTARWLLSRASTYSARSRLRAAEVAAGRFDVCHVHGLNYFTDWRSLPRLARHAAVVSTVHDVVPHETRLSARLERRLLMRMYRGAGTLVVMHDGLRSRLVEEFGVAPDRVRVIPLVFRDEMIPARSETSQTGLDVLFFGSFRRDKGIPVLLEAIDRVRLPDVRFHFAGQGAAELEEEVAEAVRRDPRVTAEIGRISNARRAELYRQASLVVLPYTRYASQSGILRDASAFRVPVVVSDVGVLGDIVGRSGAGWVVAPGDAAALAKAIESALLDPAERVRAGNALGEVPEFASFDSVGVLLRSIYDDVIDS